VVDDRKSEIVKFKKGSKPKMSKPFKFDGCPLKVVESVTYLGVLFTRSGSFKSELQQTLAKGERALGAV